MDVLLSTGSVITEAVWKCQSWLESVTDVPAAATHAVAALEPAAPLPWEVPADVAADPKVRKALKDAVLALSQDKDVFLRETPASLATMLTPQLHASAGAVLQEDAALQGLRFRLVPRRVSEEQFWQRYFAAVAELRRKLLGSNSGFGAIGGSGGGGRAVSERSTSTVAGMSIAGGSVSSPGQHLRWGAAADVKAAAASRLGKTLSQVSSLAAEALLLSPRSLLGDHGAAAPTAAADAVPAGSAAGMLLPPIAHEPHSADVCSTNASAVAFPAVTRPPGSSRTEPFAGLWDCVMPAAAALPRPDGSGAAEQPAEEVAAAAAAAASALRPQAAGSRAGAPDCASDDGDWSHCSDSFMEVGADVVSHDADWMVL